MRPPFAKLGAAVASAAIALTACGQADPPGPEAAGTPSIDTAGEELVAAVASYDVAVGDGQRFLAGLFTSERNVVLGGEVELAFFYLGEEPTTASPEPVTQVVGRFLPVPGKAPAEPLQTPTIVGPADAAGVYEARVDLDRAGFWGVTAVAEIDGARQQASASFQVREEPEVPTVGDPAPAVANRTMDSDAPLVAIDSRARGEDAVVPDPQLHDTTVTEALDENRPLVVVVSTPTYCVSQFCGPITETISDLAADYGDRAEFVHLEVWQNFEETVLNEAAAAWIQTEEGGAEPWVFLVGPDGTVQQRWDNVLDEQALVELLEDLP